MTNHTLNRIGVMHNMESWVKLCVGYLDYFYSGVVVGTLGQGLLSFPALNPESS
jgi:hypothetical protein